MHENVFFRFGILAVIMAGWLNEELAGNCYFGHHKNNLNGS